MSAITVDSCQSKIAALVDQSTTVPTGDEYSLRLSYINRAINEWEHAFDWEATKKYHWINVTGVSCASLSLPGDFKKLAGFPLYYSGGVSGGEEWEEIKSEEEKLYVSTDKYCYTLGNRNEGHTLVWNPGTLASGASLRICYYSYVTALASPADTILVPDPEFVINRSIAYILESRSDARFQETEAKARENLLQMVDSEQTAKFNSLAGGPDSNVQTNERRFWGFRIGKN